jgi:hypothetical protein
MNWTFRKVAGRTEQVMRNAEAVRPVEPARMAFSSRRADQGTSYASLDFSAALTDLEYLFCARP